MSDQDSVSATTEDSAPPPMDAHTDQLQEPLKQEKPRNVTFSIWPPTQRTRDAVIARLIETLSAPSVLSKRYGTISQEEADSFARRIEEEAYSVADAGSAAEDDGIAVLQVYSREISKRMLEAVKARTGSGPAASGGGSASVSPRSGPEPTASNEDAQSET